MPRLGKISSKSRVLMKYVRLTTYYNVKCKTAQWKLNNKMNVSMLNRIHIIFFIKSEILLSWTP